MTTRIVDDPAPGRRAHPLGNPGTRRVVPRSLAETTRPRRYHRSLPAVVTAAGPDRDHVLVQRRSIPNPLAGLLVPLVLERPDPVGLARRRTAHRAVADPQARCHRHPHHGATRRPLRDRRRPVAGPVAVRREHPDVDLVRHPRGPARRGVVVRRDQPGTADRAGHLRAGGRAGDVSGGLPRGAGARAGSPPSASNTRKPQWIWARHPPGRCGG